MWYLLCFFTFGTQDETRIKSAVLEPDICLLHVLIPPANTADIVFSKSFVSMHEDASYHMKDTMVQYLAAFKT